MIKRIISEPLFQFSFLGLSLFILFNLVSPDESDNKIIIDQYDLNELVSKWNLQWQRNPTERELKGLLDNYIKQEIYYREALAMRLDHNDEIVKRRMAQKMQFLTQDVADRVTPTDDQLKQYLQANQERYTKEKSVSFEQIYFSPDNRSEAYTDAVASLKTNNPRGDVSTLRKTYEDITLSRLSSELGSDFTLSIDSLMVLDGWQGPIKSGFGYHLVKLYQIIQPQPYNLGDIKDRIIDDYQHDHLTKINNELFSSLLDKYEVILAFEPEEQ